MIKPVNNLFTECCGAGFTTDIFNNTTTTIYDSRGNVIETISSAGTRSRKVYDAAGRVLVFTD
ncbi:MAG: RHS repeat protein [Victivallaceae bacterium]|nr:RHS repeat protein [Victivallaceae bacterium]